MRISPQTRTRLSDHAADTIPTSCNTGVDGSGGCGLGIGSGGDEVEGTKGSEEIHWFN